MTRIPYATLIATVMCLIGVGIFCGTMYRGTSFAIIMLDQVFHLRLMWYFVALLSVLNEFSRFFCFVLQD